MIHTDIELVRKEKGYALYKKGDKYTVVRVNDRGREVFSAMPNDSPKGKEKFASLTPSGIEYVTKWYSKSHAYKSFKEFMEEKDAMERLGWY